jgi:hypothetical protein
MEENYGWMNACFIGLYKQPLHRDIIAALKGDALNGPVIMDIEGICIDRPDTDYQDNDAKGYGCEFD